MNRRRLGKTELMVSPIGFGGIKLPEVEQDDATELLNAAIDRGIDFVDTARGYGDSEQKIGEALSHRRSEFYLSSKSGAVDGDSMRRDLETSLTNLKTDYLDIYFMHNLRTDEGFESVMGKGGALEALRKAQSEGLVHHVCFSSHRFLGTMKRGILCGEFEAIMVSYNILNDELVDEEVMPLAKENDLGVVAMKPLAGGALVSPAGLSIETESGQTVAINATQALRFVLSHDAVTIAIPGMTNLRELEENIAAGEIAEQMSADEKAQLAAAAGALGKEFCRNCGYCMPCPEGINIPVIFRHEGYFSRYGLKEWASNRYRMVEVKAESCVECGTCEEKCPYNLPIIEKLREAHATLTAG